MSRARGDLGEDRAVAFLEEKGYRIVARNYHSRFGEIDIIASREGVLHFIEVKSGEGEPAYRITPAKISKIIKTADIYMQKHRTACDYCIDAVIVTDTVELIENITL